MRSKGASFLSLVLATFIQLNNASAPLVYHVIEPGQTGDFVGNIVTNSFISVNYSSDVLRLLQFELLSTGAKENLFNLHRNTGLLKLAQGVDREQICPHQELCEIKLDVAVSPARYFHVIKVLVIVDDINDYAPVFSRSNVTYTVSETTAPGVLFPLMTATDLDSPKFGLQGYELHGDADKFGLHITKLGEDEVDLRLVLKSPLDRETQSVYNLELLAYDGGRPPLTGRQQVVIHVLDANDNAPQFKRRTIELEVPEDLPVNSILATVEARDFDEGENAKLQFSFDERTDKALGNLFRVDPTSGHVSLRSSLDYETQSLYSLKVIAEDKGEPPFSSTAVIIIRVSDTNDNAPIISVNSIPRATTDTAFVRIPEHEPANSMVALVSVQDLDKLENAHVTCELGNNNKKYFTLQQILENEYKLLTLIELDRERESDREQRTNYDLDVLCADHGKDPKSQTVTIKVVITDINDNRPLFPYQEYTFTIHENNNLHEFIGQVEAKDDDFGSNAQIIYELCSNGSDTRVVALDEKTGVLTARAYFDRELQDRYELCIRASDQGHPRQSSSVMVHISIMDEDDNLPIFDQSRYVFYVKENQPINTVVGRVHATDKDAPPNNESSFTFSDYGGNQFFKIDLKSGLIFTQQPLDREDEDEFDIIVLVQSDESPRHSNMCEVTIRVEDLNDNAPVIHFPSNNSTAASTIEISNKVPVGFEIAQIFATDNDLGNNSNLTYALQSNQNEFFSVNPGTGKIYTVKTMDGIDMRNFTLSLEVSDGGALPQVTLAKLNIIVNSSLPFYYPSAQNEELPRHSDMELIFIAGGASLVFLLLILILVVFCILLIKRARGPEKEYYVANQGDETDQTERNGKLKSENYYEDELQAMNLSKDSEDEAEPLPPLSNYGSMTSVPNEVIGGTGSYYDGEDHTTTHQFPNSPWVPLTPKYHTSPRYRDSPGNTTGYNYKHVTFNPIAENEEPIIMRDITHSSSGTFV